MVRSKRLRKLKLKMLTAAGILCLAAVFLVSAVIALHFFHGKGNITETVAEAATESIVQENSGVRTLADSKDYTYAVSADEIKNTDEAQEIIPEEYTESPAEADGENSEILQSGIQDDSDQDVRSAVSGQAPAGSGGAEKVYLTFDDGPSIYTDKILDILSENGVHATFFVCGTGDRDERLRHTYKRIVDEGHTIGMHSYSHVYKDVYKTLDGFEYDLDKIRNLIYNETGIAPKFYRFPGGSGNTVASLPMDRYISVLYSQDVEYYDWNVYCGDSSGKALSSGEIVRNTLRGVDRWRSSVVLLHDTGAKKSTVDALPAILKGLKDRGLEILPIDQDTPPLHQYKTQSEE